MTRVIVPWYCPRRRPLGEKRFNCLSCEECGRIFPFRGDIPEFVGDYVVGFYEQKGEIYHFPRVMHRFPSAKTRLAMFFADDDHSTNFNFLSRAMKAPGVVLDVGCGGGNGFYTLVGPTVGIDFAFSSSVRAKTVYSQVAQASVDAMPFPDNAFDYVVSTDLLEHLPAAVKDKALVEMTRVLRPGGRMIHVCPVDNRHPLMRWAKSFPDLYRRYFIELDGHDGFETAQAMLARFTQAGLRLMDVSVRKGVIWSKWEVVKRFDNEYRETASWLNGLVMFAWILAGNRWIQRVVNPGLWVLDRLLTPLFGLNDVYRIAVCLEKPK